MRSQGYIDLHIHGSGRYDTRRGGPEALLALAELEGASGVTAFLPAIYSDSIDKMRERMAVVSEAMAAQAASKKVDLGNPARILGVHLEGPFLSPARAGAQRAASFLGPGLRHLRALLKGFEELVRVITIAPELPGALRVIAECARGGIKVHMGHSDATYAQALAGKKAGATGVTHLFNAMRPMHHREPGLAGLGLLDRDLYVEVIADGIHLSAEVLELIFRVKPHGRILLVSDRVKGPQRRGDVLQGGRVPVSEAAGVLGKVGIRASLVRQAGWLNPRRYLGLGRRL